MDPETLRIDHNFLKAISLGPRRIGVGLGEVPQPIADRLAQRRLVRITGNQVQTWTV